MTATKGQTAGPCLVSFDAVALSSVTHALSFSIIFFGHISYVCHKDDLGLALWLFEMQISSAAPMVLLYKLCMHQMSSFLEVPLLLQRPNITHS